MDALNRLNYNICENGDLLEIIIEESEFDSLLKTGLFVEINKKLDVLVGDYEDELIFLRTSKCWEKFYMNLFVLIQVIRPCTRCI